MMQPIIRNACISHIRHIILVQYYFSQEILLSVTDALLLPLPSHIVHILL